MRFLSFLFTIWISYIMLRLIIVPLFLYFWARYIRAKRANEGNVRFGHKQAQQKSYSECIVNAEFEELN